MKNKWRVLLFCLTSLLFIGCDRVTKDLAKEHLMDRGPITYLHNTVVLEYVENTGAALSLGDSLPKPVSFWLLSILPLLFLIVLFVYAIRKADKLNNWKLFAFALIFAGGLGNIIDRLAFDRHVTDFMNVGIGSLRTGIFNVADMCVTAGVIVLLFAYWERNPKEDDEPKSHSELT
ncbi:MAG TPA: signal peptidase II [Mucilaginibacter sp.]|jgi:signal peptidase II|nr:signal peptidase II [Mucilaginibacter sp.]